MPLLLISDNFFFSKMKTKPNSLTFVTIIFGDNALTKCVLSKRMSVQSLCQLVSFRIKKHFDFSEISWPELLGIITDEKE